MDYYLNRVNVILIALVGTLCLWQWSGEKKADQQLENLRRVVAADESHLAAQDQAIRGANEDIDEFKKEISALKAKSDASDSEIRKDKARVFTLEQEEKQRVAEAELSAKALAAYKQGIAARDQNIHLLVDQRQQLVEANQDAVNKANSAVTAYNDVATKYATLVGQYNDLAKRYKALTAPAPDADKAASKS
jgi:septal ring factor EnvC (AmiA/AmiB activator)